MAVWTGHGSVSVYTLRFFQIATKLGHSNQASCKHSFKQIQNASDSDQLLAERFFPFFPSFARPWGHDCWRVANPARTECRATIRRRNAGLRLTLHPTSMFRWNTKGKTVVPPTNRLYFTSMFQGGYGRVTVLVARIASARRCFEASELLSATLSAVSVAGPVGTPDCPDVSVNRGVPFFVLVRPHLS